MTESNPWPALSLLVDTPVSELEENQILDGLSWVEKQGIKVRALTLCQQRKLVDHKAQLSPLPRVYGVVTMLAQILDDVTEPMDMQQTRTRLVRTFFFMKQERCALP